MSYWLAGSTICVSGTPVSVLRGHTDAITHVAFRPDGRYVVTSGQNGTARVWEARTACPWPY